MLHSRKRNDLTDSNYKFMKEVSGQTETKVIHKSGNEQYCYSLAQMTILNKVKHN